MKIALIILFVTLATIVNSQDTYPSKYDNIDIDSILNNARLLDNYIACVEETGKCTPEGEELKKHFKDAIDTCCAKCTDKQKAGVRKVFDHLQKFRADKLNELKAKFDPNSEHEKECKGKFKL